MPSDFRARDRARPIAGGSVTSRSKVDWALFLYAPIIALVFLPKMVWADTWLYQRLLTQSVLLYVGALSKIAALALGAIAAGLTRRSFARGGAMRAGFSLVAFWLGTWALGQSVLGFYQMVRLVSAPFPSAADVFFVLGYPAMLLGFLAFIRAYAQTGLLLRLRSELTLVVAVGVPLLALGFLVLRPVLAAGGTWIEVAINVAYPAFDIIALLPTVILARMALRLRGGALFWVWGLLSMATVCMVAGDLLYGWFSLLDYRSLDPLLDVAFIASYVLAARGVYQQYRISVVAVKG